MKTASFFHAPDLSGTGGGSGDADPDTGTHADGSQTLIIGPKDSIISVAKQNGFFWKTVWDHPKNSEVKSRRKVPEIIQQGDKVFIPKAEPKKVSKPTEARHKFKLKGEQAKFKIRFKQLGEPRANEDYILIVDDMTKTGKTDAQGEIHTDIPNDASGGQIILGQGKEVIPFTIGRLDPKESVSGVRQRLANVGFPMDDDPNETEMPENALEAFQVKHELKVTGKYDDATKAKLDEVHPS